MEMVQNHPTSRLFFTLDFSPAHSTIAKSTCYKLCYDAVFAIFLLVFHLKCCSMFVFRYYATTGCSKRSLFTFSTYPYMGHEKVPHLLIHGLYENKLQEPTALTPPHHHHPQIWRGWNESPRWSNDPAAMISNQFTGLAFTKCSINQTYFMNSYMQNSTCSCQN